MDTQRYLSWGSRPRDPADPLDPLSDSKHYTQLVPKFIMHAPYHILTGRDDDPAVLRYYEEQILAQVPDPVIRAALDSPFMRRQWNKGRVLLQSMSYRDHMPWEAAPQFGLAEPKLIPTKSGLTIRLFPKGPDPTIWLDVVWSDGATIAAAKRLSDKATDQIKVYNTTPYGGQARKEEVIASGDGCGTRFWPINALMGTHEVWFGSELLETIGGAITVNIGAVGALSPGK